jgi:hypothetical protein
MIAPENRKRTNENEKLLRYRGWSSGVGRRGTAGKSRRK